MLTIILLVLNAIFTSLGIYYFDYQVDQVINQPGIIVLSILMGTVLMVLVAVIYEEGFYYTIAKRKPINSMLKHVIAKQMMIVPLYGTNRRVTIIGKENLPTDPGFSIYANHTSLWDIPVLMKALYNYPVAFLEKEEVIRLPFIGKWTPALGCVMLDRSNDRKGAEAIIQVIRNVKAGSTMVIFPEGTRSPKTGTLLPFKDGSFKVALKAKKPLVPISIKKPEGIRFPFKKNIIITIHKPIPFEEIKGLKSIELSDRVRDIIVKNI